MRRKQNKSKPISSKKGAWREARRRQGLRNRVIYGILVLAGLAAAVSLFRNGASAQPIEGVVPYSALERNHVDGQVTYEQNPPVGGSHSPAWQNCGGYTEPIVNENGVHTLEHGAVWITYQPDLPDLEVQALQTLTRQSGFRLLSPYPDLPSPIVISAWGYQLQIEQADDPRLKDFIEQYELSPQGPEPGAPCTGGVGQPG